MKNKIKTSLYAEINGVRIAITVNGGRKTAINTAKRTILGDFKVYRITETKTSK